MNKAAAVDRSPIMKCLLKGIDYEVAWAVQIDCQPTMRRANAPMTKIT